LPQIPVKKITTFRNRTDYIFEMPIRMNHLGRSTKP